MHGLWTSSSSRVWIVLSSMSRAPTSHDATMFWAIWVCGPAATPNGVSSSTPYSRRRKRWSDRGAKKADRGTLNSDAFRSSSVKAQSVSCSIEIGWNRSVMGRSSSGRARVRSVRRQRRACSRAACSRAFARISTGSTRVGLPSAKTTSPPTSTRNGRIPAVKATCHGSIGS